LKNVLSERLYLLSQEKANEQSGETVPKQAEAMNIPYTTLLKYIKGVTECPSSNLIKIARYYGVCTDYLLGLTDRRSMTVDVGAIMEQLNLSNDAVRQLSTPWIYKEVHTVMRYDGQYEQIEAVMDKFISSNMIFELSMKMNEEQIRFIQFVCKLKRTKIAEDDDGFDFATDALDLIREWKLGNEGVSHRITDILTKFKDEYYKSEEQIIQSLEDKLWEIRLSRHGEARKKCVDDFLDTLNNIEI